MTYFTVQYVNFYAERKGEVFRELATAEKRVAAMTDKPGHYRHIRIVEGFVIPRNNQTWWR